MHETGGLGSFMYDSGSKCITGQRTSLTNAFGIHGHTEKESEIHLQPSLRGKYKVHMLCIVSFLFCII